ncbi:MAG: 4Fe-4S binding protein [Thermoleophilia bacterium]|nr:4Fe-4S binding protein [Thermoleophilia bacterium]
MTGWRKTKYVRFAVQVISLVFYLTLLVRLAYPPGTSSAVLLWISRLDPWVPLVRLRWPMGFALWMLLPLAVVILTLLLGRVFCGWFCPFGALMMLFDEGTRLVFKKRRWARFPRLRVRVLEAVARWRYAWLAFLVVLFLVGLDVAYPLTPFALFNSEVTRLLGGGLPWVLVVLVILTVLVGRVWCSALCPTGMLLSVFGRFRVFGYEAAPECSSCGRCVRNCPIAAARAPMAATATAAAPGTSAGAQPTAFGARAADGACLACGTCEATCAREGVRFTRLRFRKRAPGGDARHETVAALNRETVGELDQVKGADLDHERREAGGGFSRREFIRISAFSAAGLALGLSLRGLWSGEALPVLRPPGAVSETRFRSLCSGCGRCVKVCPNEALVPMSLLEGLDVWGTPKIIPRQANCNLCLACQEVCPSEAIVRVPLEQIKMGTAAIDRRRCLSWTGEKECWVCGETCPISAISIDRKLRPHVTERCVGCGTCEYNCPVEGTAAIRVTPTAVRVTSNESP